MNQPTTSLATCPTCNGSGVRTKTWVKWGSEREREKPQRCLACRGAGQVDSLRVCPACGNWIDGCTCAKSKIIKLEAGDMSEATGVRWNNRDKRWQATIYKDGKTHYLGQYKDQAAAISIRLKAEQLPSSAYEALKAEYQQYRGNGHAEAQAEFNPQPDEAVVEAEVPDADDVLHQKLVAARKADQRFLAIREQYCAAERDAVEAWNEYARELAAYAQSDTFARSYLGFLREEITRS